MLRWTSLPLSVLLLCQQFESALAIWPFSSKRFTANTMISAGTLGLDAQSRVLAFGDFNGDQFLDVISLSSDQQTFSIYLWDHGTFQFQSSFSHKHSTRINNVVPSDFNHDGKLDLLVMSQDSGKSRTSMTLYLALVSGGFDTNGIEVPDSSLPQPIPLDVNGDLIVDLLGSDPSSRTLKMWKNQWNETLSPSTPFLVADPPFTGGTPCEIDDPHSNAVIDLDGDCLADIFLQCKPASSSGSSTYQIWINNKSSGFSLNATGSLPPNAGQITFADMDRDGTMDMVFPTCSSVSRTTGVGTDCYINIAYNQQLPLCRDTSFPGLRDTACRRPDDLCTADENFKFEFDESNREAFVRIPLNDLFPSLKSSGLVLYDTTLTPRVPQGIKLGDANLDGFPDLLFILAGDKHGGFLGIGDVVDQIPSVIFSVPCKKDMLGCDSNGHGKSGYTALTKDAEALSSITDAASVSFMDIDEDGTLDILVQRTGVQGQGSISFVQNNFFFDAFFLKAIVLNGACGNSICIAANDSIKYMPFGVSYSGASYKYTVLDTFGGRSAAQAGQLPQTSYQSLQTPYSFIGLGRTNNYIENLFVGSTLHLDQHFINMEGVIPNSKVVFKPPAVIDGKQQGNWKKELYLRPGAWIPWVTVTVVATMGLLALIVLILQINEKREDEMERRRASHMINFDAL